MESAHVLKQERRFVQITDVLICKHLQWRVDRVMPQDVPVIPNAVVGCVRMSIQYKIVAHVIRNALVPTLVAVLEYAKI
jgi:hypothetical protein